MSNTTHNQQKSTPIVSDSADEPGGASRPDITPNPDEDSFPFTQKVKGKIARLFNLRVANPLENELSNFIDGHSSDAVFAEEQSILHNVIGLSDSKVSDVMIPRTDIIAVENTISIGELKQVIIDKEHTRIPIYKGSLDNVIGFVHIKDLLPLFDKNEFDINNVLREILYIPPSMKTLDLLIKMRAKRVHMALVLDEYGGTDGLVTMEDLMEEIVGEIEDEHDDFEEDEIKVIDSNTLEINARISVELLERRLGVRLMPDEEDEDFDTVGGLIFFMLGHVPEVGEVVKHSSGYHFEVLEADPRRVKKIMVRKVI
jgi:magnesium and cobalt transporter